VAKLVADLPGHVVSDLQCVVLTNALAVGEGKTQRLKGKKHSRRTCLGFYHRKQKGERAWIEIIVDNAFAEYSPDGLGFVISHLPIVREIPLASVLFHELGHHLDYTVGAPAPSGEAAAEAWQKRLLNSYLRKRLRLLIPILRLGRRVVRLTGIR
jgi:hypothetical protein